MSLQGRSISPVGFVSVVREPLPSSIASGPAQTSDTTTGVPMALASLTVSPWTSYHSDGKTSARAARIIARATSGVFQPRMRASV